MLENRLGNCFILTPSIDLNFTLTRIRLSCYVTVIGKPILSPTHYTHVNLDEFKAGSILMKMKVHNRGVSVHNTGKLTVQPASTLDPE